ncbi:MAG: hypothetical protein AB7O91_04870 [Sphingomonas sp.]
MYDKRKPKLHWPLALLAATPQPAFNPSRPAPHELRRLVAAMVD